MVGRCVRQQKAPPPPTQAKGRVRGQRKSEVVVVVGRQKRQMQVVEIMKQGGRQAYREEEEGR